MEHPDAVLQKIARAAHLREGPAGVEAFLRQLHREMPLPLAELARRLGWPVPVAAAVRGELERAGLVARAPGGVALSAVGQEWAHDALGLATREDSLCPTCAGRRIVVDPARWADVLACLEEVHRANPVVDTTLDQSHGTPETALRRALAMYQEGALEGRDILLLGDDDLVSVAIGLLANPRHPVTPSLPYNKENGGQGDEGTRKQGDEEIENGSAGIRPRRLAVLDVDERFLVHIAAAGQTYGFPVETVAHDLRAPLPEALQAAFDTVETDPPYTMPGLRLFLSRAQEALRPGSGRDIFLSFAPRDPEGQRALLQTCVELGLAPYSVTPDFNRYAGAATLGHSGQFLHLRTTEASTAQPAGHYDGPLYTMEERPSRRTYRCLGCGAEHIVGPGSDFATIELLAAKGCPRCGGRRFRPGKRTRGSAGQVRGHK
jgi:predicted methyltransferase/DNA-directed RNA polymerase subunit RPC12/RpoP